MKKPDPTRITRVPLKHFALVTMFSLACLPAQAQSISHVGGTGVIGDEVLLTVAGVATVPRGNVHWTAAGGDGVVYSRLNSPTLTVPTAGPVTLKFNHRYFFEDGWDGGAVYVTVNGSGPTYLGAAAFTTNGYVSDLSGANSSVFRQGEQVFTGQSSGWNTAALIESDVNLGTFAAGDTISIQFRGGWDEGTKEAAPNWEIGTVEVRDAANTAMLNVDFINGSGGFTATSDVGLAGPWVYLGPRVEFEIDGDTLAADRYVPDVAGSIIDINHTDLSVVLLSGTLEPGDVFTLFDLSGGTTLTGTYDNITLPAGRWDLSKLAVNGTILYTAESKMLSFTFPSFGDATINEAAKTIHKYLPEGTILTTLTTDFTMSDGATCKVAGNPVVSGSTHNFTNPVAFVVTASDNSNSTTYTVTISLIPVESTVTWNLASGGTWDISTLNWLGQISGLATTFTDGNNVIFDKAAGGVITVTPAMAPGSVSVTATSGTYTFSGGAIDGAGGLTKAGGGTLVINNTNSYTGKTIIQAGRLDTALGANYLSNAGVPGVFGAATGPAATIDLYNGVILQNNGSNPRLNQATDRPLNLAGTGSGTTTIRFNDNDASLTFGAVTATGTGAKTLALFTGCNGNGDREAIIFTGAIADSSDGSPTSLQVNFKTQTGSHSYVSLSGVNTFTGPITLVQGGGPATGHLMIGGVRAAISGANTVGSGTLGNGNYPGAIVLATSSILEYDSTATQTLAGVISGDGAVTVIGSGKLTLSGANTYVGTTSVNAGTLLVDGTSSATSAVNVAAAATLGGSGTIGGATTIANNAKLAFTLSSLAASHDKLDISSTLAFTGASELDITASGSLPAPGLYTLVTAAAGISGIAPATLILPPGWAATVSISGTDLLLDVTSTGTLDPYSTWINGAAYNTPPLSDAQKLPTADPDHDGLTNQQEFAFGLSPVSASSCNPITQQLNKTTGTFKYTRNVGTGLTFTYESSTTLAAGSWSSFTPDSATSDNATPVEVITVKVPSSLLTDTKLFLHVKAQ